MGEAGVLGSVTIRVDDEVYAKVLERKHQMEQETGRLWSMNETLKLMIEEAR